MSHWLAMNSRDAKETAEEEDELHQVILFKQRIVVSSSGVEGLCSATPAALDCEPFVPISGGWAWEWAAFNLSIFIGWLRVRLTKSILDFDWYQIDINIWSERLLFYTWPAGCAVSAAGLLFYLIQSLAKTVAETLNRQKQKFWNE